MSHGAPSRSPPLSQPSPTAHSKPCHLPLSEKPLPGPGLLFKACPGIGDMGAMQPGTLTLHPVISGRVPKEVAPKKSSHAVPTSGALKPPQEQTASRGWGEPHPREPRPGYREPRSPGRTCSRYASRGGRRLLPTPSPSWTQRGRWRWGLATAPLLPPRDRDPPGSPGPRPLQPSSGSDSGGAAGIQTAAAAISPGASSYGNEAGPPKRAR